MEDNIRVENRNYDPENILHIGELAYNKMVENGLQTVHWNIPGSSFILNTTLLELWR